MSHPAKAAEPTTVNEHRAMSNHLDNAATSFPKAIYIQHKGKTVEVKPEADTEVQPTRWRLTRFVFTTHVAYPAPGSLEYAIYGAFIAFPAIGVTLLAARGELLFAAYGLILLLGLVLFWISIAEPYVSSVRISKTTGLVTFRAPGETFKVPLTNTVAVQVVPGKKVSILPFVHRTAYQFKMIFDDSELESITLSYCPDKNWARKTGEQLAKFLGVPFVDHCSALPRQ